MKIDVIYELVGPNGELPNGINLNDNSLFDLIKECNWLWHGPGMGDLFTKYEKKYNHHVPVFLNGLPIQQDKFLKKSILSITSPRRDVLDDTIYLFPIGVFGSLDVSLGMYPDTPSAISCLSDKAVEYINKFENIFLFFNHTEEGEFTREHVEKFTEEINKRKIDYNKVIFGTACYNAKEVFNKYSPKLSENLKILFHNWALRSCAGHWYNIKEDSNYKFYADIPHTESIVLEGDIDSSKLRKNKFLSFNNKVRNHRIMFLSILNNLKELDSNLISYDIRDNLKLSIQKTKDLIFQNTDGISDISTRWTSVENIDTLVQTVDIENIRSARGHGWDRKEVYLDSYINLTTETLFFEDCYYMSEKIFKPIANLQPFINIGSPYTLRELRKLGFKTFSDFWDESYDEETNPIKRMEKIEKLIIWLSEMSMDEIHQLYHKMLPISIYNQNKLFEYENHRKIDKDFLQFCREIYPGVAQSDTAEEASQII